MYNPREAGIMKRNFPSFVRSLIEIRGAEPMLLDCSRPMLLETWGNEAGLLI